MEASRNGIGENTVSKKKKGQVEKEANPYDEVDFWLWPNRRIDLNYASLTVDEVAELDRRVEGRGFLGAAPLEIAKVWVASGSADRELAHAWHLARAGLDFSECVYEPAPFGMSPHLFRVTGYDAWSGPLYTDFCSVAEFQRVFIPFAACACAWLGRGIAQLDRGVSALEFTFCERSAIVKVSKHFRLIRDRSAAVADVDPIALVPDQSWKNFRGWPDIYVFLACAPGWIEGLSRLKRLELKRSDRRVTNKFLNVITTMGTGNLPLVYAIANEGAGLFHEK